MKAEIIVTRCKNGDEIDLFVDTEKDHDVLIKTGMVTNQFTIYHEMLDNILKNLKNQVTKVNLGDMTSIEIHCLEKGNIIRIWDWSFLEDEDGNEEIRFDEKERYTARFEIIEIDVFPFKNKRNFTTKYFPCVNTLKIRELDTNKIFFTRHSYVTLVSKS